jgi:hypothetical protein
LGQLSDLARLYGTSEPPQKLQEVAIGDLSFLYAADGLRRLSWRGVELVRGLSWPIRDENWGTYPAELIDESVEGSDHEFEARLRFAVAEGRLLCDVRLAALRAGELFADLVMTPQRGAFATNRAGFTVLHPIQGVAGAELTVKRHGGALETTRFPELIQPDQPVKDISGLNYRVGGAQVDIAFEGEIFEMEDQRNWSDASFKTYCVPLVHPFTYQIVEPVRQSLRLTFEGGGQGTGLGATSARPVSFAATGAETPQIGVAVQADWLPSAETPVPEVSHALMRVTGGEDLSGVAKAAQRFRAVDLEIVLPDAVSGQDALIAIAAELARHDIEPRHVMALPEGYLASHQPSGPWPQGATPNDLLDDLRSAFPSAKILGGMMTNFTEVNRCRPDPARCDGITHGLTPLVHAGDDMSVLETLETLPQIFASAEALAPDAAYRLGLVSIGMRSNPYGAAVAENPAQLRRTMGQIDPRHRGLFGAAFAVGVLAATENHAVEALCLGAPTGPFGLAHAALPVPQEGYDGAGRAVYPLFHVVRHAARMAGLARLAMAGLPSGVAGYAARGEGGVIGLLANLTDRSVRLNLSEPICAQVLDLQSFEAATCDATWLTRTAPVRSETLELGPFAVACLDGEA